MVAMVGAVLSLLGLASSSNSSRTDTRPPAAAITPAPSVPAATSPSPSLLQVQLGQPTRLQIPSVGIDTAVDGIKGKNLNPPRLDKAYWWTDRGAPGSPDTTFIVGHSCRQCSAVFNSLQRVAPGTPIYVSTTAGQRLQYVVQQQQQYPKSTITQHSDVYLKDPYRLVLVTCYLEVNGKPSTDNDVVYAELPHQS